MQRCAWCESSDLMRAYHDTEWGVPLHDDRRHFEFLILDAFQAGLSWSTILNKRENFRRAFSNFEPERVARYGQAQIQRLLADTGIVRNRQKIDAAIKNAKAFLQVQKDEGSFDAFIWQFVGGKPIRHRFKSMQEIPAFSPESDAMSKELKKRGFAFVGSTICYAYMQAAGMVNDHETGCFRYRQVQAPSR